MSRQGLVVIAFVFGLFAAPLAARLLDSSLSVVTAQDDELPVPRIDAIPEDDGEEPPRRNRGPVPVEHVPNPQLGYLELVKQKISLLSAEELQRETQVLHRELVELKATQKLRQAAQILQQLIEEHPNTSAAKKAHSMLESMANSSPHRKGHVPTPSDDRDAELFENPRPRSNTFNPQGSYSPERTFAPENAFDLEQEVVAPKREEPAGINLRDIKR